MQNISIHISKLLFDNERVIVSGLGYFEASEQKAYHHPVSHNYSPKSKAISFHLDKNAKDDMLAKSIASTDAALSISNFSKKIITELMAGKKVELANLGTLSKHEKGHIVFVQDKDFVFDKEFFGMPSFVQKPINIAEPSPIVKKEVVEEKGSSKMLLWLIISGVAASIILAFVFLKPDSNETELVEVDTPVEEIKDKEVNDDEVIQNDTYDTDSINQTDVAVNEAKEIEPKVEAEEVDAIQIEAPKGDYYVMAGCFKSKYKANRYLKELKNGEYPNASIKGKTPSGLIRVCYNNFANEAEAEQYMNKISQQENKELWMQLIED
ncbi:MAG: hypothetical protein B6I18_07420 [Bacteroidetes bacterium 4572_112]|nr:MAG: hypothetical protein B6I18_07420 [Bacteroidetes bacterium 4572_112]